MSCVGGLKRDTKCDQGYGNTLDSIPGVTVSTPEEKKRGVRSHRGKKVRYLQGGGPMEGGGGLTLRAVEGRLRIREKNALLRTHEKLREPGKLLGKLHY